MRGALITGGTSGIGLAFAHALAREGTPLVLVARDPARLDAVASDLGGRYGVAVEILAADLSTRPGQDAVAARLRDGDVDMLVNNAGFSVKTPLVGGDDDLLDAAWEAMGRAPRILAAAAASAWLAGRPDAAAAVSTRRFIINVASVSGLTRQDAYSALKAYVLAFSEVLAGELAATGITVTAVLPGWVRTDFHAGGGRSGLPPIAWLAPDRVAAEALRDARAGKVVCVPSRRYRAAVTALNLLPSGAVRALSRRLAGQPRRTVPPPEGDLP